MTVYYKQVESDCPICKGTGQSNQLEFSHEKKLLKRNCSTCKAKGKLYDFVPVEVSGVPTKLNLGKWANEYSADPETAAHYFHGAESALDTIVPLIAELQEKNRQMEEENLKLEEEIANLTAIANGETPEIH